jgi:chromosomal replication initiation ATPase DnaA
MEENSFPNPVWTLGLETRVAILREKAEQKKVILPEDVALYIAQNIGPDPRALEGALACLIAHSSLIGADITLNYAKNVLKGFVGQPPHTATVHPFQKMFLGQRDAKKTDRTRPVAATPDPRFVLSLLKTRQGGKIDRVTQEVVEVQMQFEVNMRERERDQLARRDAYERALERRSKTRRRA